MNKKRNLIILLLIVVIGLLAYVSLEQKNINSDTSNAALEKIAISRGLKKGYTLTVQQCSVQGQIYFADDMRPVDGPLVIYDSQGNMAADCGGGMMAYDPNSPQPTYPQICNQINSYNCPTVSYTR